MGHVPLPRVDDALGSLGKDKYFSKMSANSGFWQIKLDESSKELTTFITPFGRYGFSQMLFGVTSAPENFQRQISKTLQDQDSALCHMDDTLVLGETEQEHDSRLEQVLCQFKGIGLTLNKEKC